MATAVQSTTQAAGTMVSPTSTPTSVHDVPRRLDRMRICTEVRFARAIASTRPSSSSGEVVSSGVVSSRMTAAPTAIVPTTTTRPISSLSRLPVTSSLELCPPTIGVLPRAGRFGSTCRKRNEVRGRVHVPQSQSVPRMAFSLHVRNREN
jgi:hypothetical protein